MATGTKQEKHNEMKQGMKQGKKLTTTDHMVTKAYEKASGRQRGEESGRAECTSKRRKVKRKTTVNV